MAVLRATPPADFPWVAAILASDPASDATDESPTEVVSIGHTGEWYIPEKSGRITKVGTDGMVEIEELRYLRSSVGAPIVSAAGVVFNKASGRVLGTGTSRGRPYRALFRAGIVNTVTIDDPSRFVSRRHAIIRHDYTIEDLRSTNGTTVNSNYLAYGSVARLNDGDIVVLANTQALRFAADVYAGEGEKPSGTWGILIDGSTRSYFYLTESVYSLHAEIGGINLVPRDDDDGIFVIRKKGRGLEMLDPLDEWSARVSIRISDGDYESLELDSNSWFELMSFPIELNQPATLDSDSRAIVFQVVDVR